MGYNNPSMRGILITVEGVEGAGKSTQCRLLARRLSAKGFTIRETSEPDGTPLGEAIRSLFERERIEPAPLSEAFLFLAARHQHVERVIRPALARGEIVISDRYSDATLAYQGYGRRLDLPMIRELNDFATGRLRPDLTLVLDLDPAVGLRRLGGRHLDAFEKMDQAFHSRVRQGYLDIAREEKDRVIVIHADQSVESLEAEIWSAVEERLQLREAIL